MFAVFLTIFFGEEGGGGEHFWHIKSACSDKRSTLFTGLTSSMRGPREIVFLKVARQFTIQDANRGCVFVYT